MQTATQLGLMPTRKLASAVITQAMVSAAWVEVMTDLAPTLAGSGVATLAGAVIALAVGYFVPDRPNVSN